MENVLFVVSMVCVIHWVVKMISCIFGNSVTLPVPVLHKFNVTFSNVYISTPAIAYQVWFWCSKLEVI